VTRKRLRWIAVQAVVVTVLAVVVVVTLLKPESHSPLSGIGGETPTVAEGPSGGSPGAGPGGGNSGGGPGAGHGGHNGGPGNGNGNGNGGSTGGGHGGNAAPTGTSTASAGGSPPIASTPVPETSPVRPEGGVPSETPTEDQYADSLGAIDSALR
jgi:hypothetical protein